MNNFRDFFFFFYFSKQQSLSVNNYRMQQRSPSPEAPPAPKEYVQQEESNPDLEKYLNRSYWEQRKITESPMASPSAPIPTPQPQQMQQQMPIKMMKVSFFFLEF